MFKNFQNKRGAKKDMKLLYWRYQKDLKFNGDLADKDNLHLALKLLVRWNTETFHVPQDYVLKAFDEAKRKYDPAWQPQHMDKVHIDMWVAQALGPDPWRDFENGKD